MRGCVDPRKAHLMLAYDSLNEEERAELEEHLNRCPACRKMSGVFKRIYDHLHAEEDRRKGRHPRPEDLLALKGRGGEQLSNGSSREIQRHLEECEECRELHRLLEDLEEEKEEIWEEGGTEIHADLKNSSRRLKSVIFGTEEEHAAASPPEGRPDTVKHRGLLGILLRNRTPLWIPAVLAAVLVLVLTILFQSSPIIDHGTWLEVGDLVEYYVPLQSRGAGEEPAACKVSPGDILEITLPKVPVSGVPIVLEVRGTQGSRVLERRPFRIEEGFPVLSMRVPELASGEYPASVKSGTDQKEIHGFKLIVEAGDNP